MKLLTRLRDEFSSQIIAHTTGSTISKVQRNAKVASALLSKATKVSASTKN
ncbi:hypothetical protein F9B74_00440 [Pelistega sp. NLN82]|uniref:Uncharacterized protein n=1 Tax=Pelistega ratti TaxID=2652177 RepID=A0A6L9Y365_9BURK|nr:hypothetical protein [Pelistega ratti]NEN74799.1 hypothetical protein [Pelistega ratti]